MTTAVTARRSLASKDHIISMIDGKPYKTLRRHLSTHGLTPADYRQRYNLKADYPMVAPSYSEARRSMAQKIGLGRKSGVRAVPTAPAVSPAEILAGPGPAKRGRKPKSAAPTPAEKPMTRGRKPKAVMFERNVDVGRMAEHVEKRPKREPLGAIRLKPEIHP